MKFFADMHIHSRYSRATSKALTLRTLADGAFRKGISVLGTGDFTHPAWFYEIENELEEAEPGLFRLKKNPGTVRFMLTAEISTIYKQGEKVRKVHHLLAAPGLESARRISTSLARIGNILSDGRPILGITSRNLLEIVLEANSQAMLIPAHIWTPWFSVLGSKSGFDTIDECYGDLAKHVFAAETGLSSDPPMNWMVKSLDRFHLISNSDAHSAEKLGREATIFECGIDYFAMRHAMEKGIGLHGTVEFFPEEGKYHLDGHRDCGVVMSPEETRERGGICPVCGRKVTVGVLSRVEELADRHDGSRPRSGRPFYSLIPLTEILGEIMQTGSTSKRVAEAYGSLVSKLGGELGILLNADIEEIRAAAGDVPALAVDRMRKGEVHKEAGYDGNFGRIRVFRDNEQDMLFSGGMRARPVKRAGRPKRNDETSGPEKNSGRPGLNPEQEEAARCRERHLIVRAGPGTGKTRVLVDRMSALMKEGPVLAVTFTTKAAREIRERLGNPDADVYTFHALASKILTEAGTAFHIADEDMIAEILSGWGEERSHAAIADMMFRLSTGAPLDTGQEHVLDTLRSEGYYTYEGMIREAVSIMAEERFTPCWDHILVDEFQDINPLQYEFMKALGSRAESLMVIGDPNQAIYGFRGSSRTCFADFQWDYPDAVTLTLKSSYRFGTHISQASNAFIGQEAVTGTRKDSPIRIVMAPGAGEYIAREIESLAGGLSHLATGKSKAEYGLSDIAVIVRTRHQARPFMDALARSSIPYDTAYAGTLASVNGVAQRLALLEQRDWQLYVKGVGERSLKKLGLVSEVNPEIARRIDEAHQAITSQKGTVMERLAGLEATGMFKLPPLDEDHAFYQYARMFGDDTEGLIRHLRLTNDQGALQSERVHIMTAHAAKGLEFRCVFIAGLSLGTFPLSGEDMAEEENLFYVAMTRATDILYLVGPPGALSPFVMRIPQECCTVHKETRKSRTEQLVLFE